MVLAGATLGLLVVAGWYITGVLAQDEFDPTKPSGVTVSGPLARFGYILIAAKFPALLFSISFVIGIVTAVFVSSLATQRFKFEVPKTDTIKFFSTFYAHNMTTIWNHFEYSIAMVNRIISCRLKKQMILTPHNQ